MIQEISTLLSGWSATDTWIVVTAALAAMACALPGAFLMLRRQSMMGDALSHTMLLGIASGFLITHGFYQAGWISDAAYPVWRHLGIFAGAIVIGLSSALLTQAVIRWGRVEPSAALGVVFTTLFALGLVLLRMAADKVDIDPDCVLYGMIETTSIHTLPGSEVPVAAVVCGSVFLVNLLLVTACFKELAISTFDPQMASAQGIPAGWVHYAVMGLTAVTLVAAFESVGSILVIAMLIVPGATASLLTDRLGRLLAWSVLIAALAAGLGHVLAIVAPPIIFGRLGYASVRDASTAGMMAVAAGLLLLLAILFAPRYGYLSRLLVRWQLGLRIVREDVLGFLYRAEELRRDRRPLGAAYHSPLTTHHSLFDRNSLRQALGAVRLPLQLALWQLRRWQWVGLADEGWQLTDPGRLAAREVVRSHRLWESYMARHFQVPDDHLHPTAERVEHFIDLEVRGQLAAELEQPEVDPHGQAIPAETTAGGGEPHNGLDPVQKN